MPQRAWVSRPIQVVPRAGRRALLHALPVRGTECLASDPVGRAEGWRWGSLDRGRYGSATEKALLPAWPLRRPADWVEEANGPQTEAELLVAAALGAARRFLRRGIVGRPHLSAGWGWRVPCVHKGVREGTTTVPDACGARTGCLPGVSSNLECREMGPI
jgi:hypothetical protein